jgi:hypothetical protein
MTVGARALFRAAGRLNESIERADGEAGEGDIIPGMVSLSAEARSMLSKTPPPRREEQHDEQPLAGSVEERVRRVRGDGP